MKITRKSPISGNVNTLDLNITDEHFDFTMRSVGSSKVDKMMIEREFSDKALQYCESLNDCAREKGRVDFIEVKEGKVKGYCLDDDAQALFDQPEFLDDQIIFVAKIMLLANRWFGAKIDRDEIPMLIGENK